MPSTRRTFLAAALAAGAGCSRLPPQTEPATGATETTATPNTPTDGPDLARWSYETQHGSLGLVALGGGPETPTVYAASGADPEADEGEGGDDADRPHALYALEPAEGTERWRASLPGPAASRPLYGETDDGGRLYVATGRERPRHRGFAVHALDPGDGEHRWSVAAEDGTALYPLVARDGAVYVGRDGEGDRTGYVAALDGVDGAERWRVETPDVSRGGTGRRRDTLVVSTAGGVRALDAADGDERWRLAGSDGDLRGPALDARGERVFLGREGVVRAVGLADGRERWRREFDFGVSRVLTPRETMSTTVFVGDADGRLLALSRLDGETRWTLPVEAEGFRPTVQRRSDALYVGGAGVHAVDPVSGERAWSFTPDVEGALDAHAARTVFASDARGSGVWALDPETGAERWRYAPDREVVGPAAAGHLAWVGVGGTVHALDGTDAS